MKQTGRRERETDNVREQFIQFAGKFHFGPFFRRYIMSESDTYLWDIIQFRSCVWEKINEFIGENCSGNSS